MRLPGVISKKLFNKTADNGDKTKVSFVVLFELSTVTVAIFTVELDKVNILTHKSATFSGSIPDSIETLDALFTGISQDFPETEHLEETIFGLSQEYVEKDEIKPDIKEHLKKLVKELSLKPTGFVVISEALAYFLSSKSGMQESAIFVGVYPSETQVSLMKIGSIVEEKTIARTDNLCLDVKSALFDFKQEVLPAKIVLYDGTNDLGKTKDEFMNFAWDKESNFLHFPKIEVLPAQTTLLAVVGAYSQKNFVQMDGDSSEAKPEDVGFSSDDDLHKYKDPVLEKEQRLLEKDPKSKLPSLPDFKMPSFSFRPKVSMVSIFIMLLVLLFASAVGVQLFYSSGAELRIIVDRKIYEQELEFILDPKVKDVDVEKKIIPGKTVTVSLEGEASQDTEGTKLIGEPATGKITVYNKLSSSRKLSKGENLIAPNKIRYSLDEEVSIASASVKEDQGSKTIVYGKEQVSVTAIDIGPDGNISSGTELVFEDFASSEYSATADEEFSGGTSREISVVGKEDVLALEKKIVDDLKNKAKSDIESNKDGKITVVDDTIESEIVSEKLSDKVGEQAKTVSLSAKVNFTALGYNPEDIVLLLKQGAQVKIPEGYKMQAGFSRQTILDKTVNKDGSVDFNASFASMLVPDIDTNVIGQLVEGKKVTDLEKELRSQKMVSGFEVSFSRFFPFITPLRLPSGDKLKVVISTR